MFLSLDFLYCQIFIVQLGLTINSFRKLHCFKLYFVARKEQNVGKYMYDLLKKRKRNRDFNISTSLRHFQMDSTPFSYVFLLKMS